ncbi:MAG: diguanylate cyclase [Candidatus Korobacteraceae bacterium]
MASEIEVVHAQREAQSDATTPVEDSAAASLVRSGALAETVSQAPMGPPKPPIKDSRQLSAGLGMSFALLIVILLGTAYLTLHRMQRMNASAEETLNEGLLELQLGQEALRYSSENSRITMQIFLVQRQEEIDELLARRAENTRQISVLVAALEAHCDSGEGKRLLATVEQTRGPYIDSYLRALHLLLSEKNRVAATELMVQQTTPALYRYHAAWEDFLRFNNEQVRVANEQSKQRETTARRIVLAFILIMGVLAAAIAWLATRKVAREVTSRIRMQEKVSELNTDLERRVAQRTQELARSDEQLRHSLEEMQEYTKEIEAINELVQLLQSCLTLDEARQQASRILQQFFPSGAMLMLNPSRNLLEVVLSWGASAVKPGPFAPESCWALRKGCVHVVQPNNISLLCEHIEPASAACHLCVPMVAQGDSLGVLSINDSGLCDSIAHPRLLRRKQELATTVAEQISLAFANLTLRETLKYQSVRDPLTGLFNRRHMEESLERELLRAARNAKPVTVLMIDIDRFKLFNDTFGHEAGDLLLRELGSVFTSITRGGDIACRYGGEEFLLILTEASLETGCERAAKLREQVANLQIHYRGETLRRITVSIGVAAFPQHGTSAAPLLRMADEALYRAKAGGKDRVVVADAPSTDTPSPCLSNSG